METYQRAVPSDACLTQLLTRVHFIAIVATTQDEVVGGLAAYVLDKFERQQREIYIYDLVVMKGHAATALRPGCWKRSPDHKEICQCSKEHVTAKRFAGHLMACRHR